MSYLIAYLMVITAALQLSKKGSMIYNYGRRNWVAIDQWAYAAFFWGNEDLTISGRAGVEMQKGQRYWTLFGRGINAFFRDPHHCEQSIEADERIVAPPIKERLPATIAGALAVYILATLLKGVM